MCVTGDVFTSPAAALSYYKRFSRLLALLNDAGMAAALPEGGGFNATLLAPRNAVLQAAAPQLARLPAGGIADVLRLHVIRGYHAVPTGLAPHTPYATLLKGYTVSFDYAWCVRAGASTACPLCKHGLLMHARMLTLSLLQRARAGTRSPCRAPTGRRACCAPPSCLRAVVHQSRWCLSTCLPQQA